jgi:hypothetical protein
MRIVLAALALAAAACSGNAGTLEVTLTTAPGSHLLDGVQTLRLTVTDPHTVATAQRMGSGFDIAVDLPATGAGGSLIVDGLDASGTVIATGASPPIPISAIDAEVVIYMAAPNSVGAAPVGLPEARSELGVGSLGYGAIFAGGADATGAPSDEVDVYNAYDQSLVEGMAMPSPRAGLALGVGAGSAVYLFGGRDGSGQPTATFWRFDTTIAPDGSYADFGDKTGFARVDQLAVPIGNEHFLITGSPAAELSGLDGSVVAPFGAAALPAAGTSVAGSDGILTALFAGPSGVVRFRNGTFDMPAAPDAARAGATVVALPGAKLGVVCGGADAVRIDAATAAVETFPGVPATPRTGCAAAATSRDLVIAGGTLASGGVTDSVEVFDATSLAPIATAQLGVARTGATAIALPNGQVLIAGGIDGSGAPIATLELFTPASDESPASDE